MLKTSIVMSVYNDYELCRQCIESILHTIFDEIEEIIIVDDYSDFKCQLRPYLNYLDNKYDKIKIIKSNEYRVSIHASQHHIDIAKRRNQPELENIVFKRPTMGHGYALQQGINRSKTDIILCIDQDIVFLENSKSMIEDVHKLLINNPKVACISQLAGLMSNNFDIVKKIFNYKMTEKPMRVGGTPAGPVFFLRKELRDKNGNQIPLFPFPRHRGWLLSGYMPILFDNGYYTMNYPVFSGKKMFHCGGCSIKKARFGGDAGIKNIKFGMLRDGDHYGGRIGRDLIAEWYVGRYILDMDTLDYISYLKNKYDKPYDEIQPLIDEKKLYIANKEVFVKEENRDC